MTTSPRAGPSAQATKTASANGTSEKIQDVYTSLQPGALASANQLARLMIEEPHRFALHGDQQLVSSGLDALKALFDFSVETEGPAIPAIAEALRSVFPDDDKVSTRSGGAKRKRRGGRAASPPKSHRLFEPTPLSELVTDGMVDSQVWDQLELRNNKICTLLDAVIVTEDGGEEDDADDESDDVSEDEALDEVEKKRRTVVQDSDDDEEDEDEEGPLEDEIMRNISQLTDADLRALGIDPAQRETLEALSAQAGEDDDEDESEDDDDGGEGYPGASDLSEDDELSGVIVTEPLLTEAEQQKRKAAAEAEERRQLRSQRQMMKMMQRMQEGAEDDDAEESDDDEEEEEEDDDDEEDESYEDEEEDEDTDEEQEGEDESSVKSLLDNLDAPGSNNASPSKAANGRRGAAVDDAFFSIDQFNRDTDDYGDDGVDLGDDVDLFTSLDDQEEQEQETPLYYADFFAAPPNKDQVKRKPEKAGRAGAKAQAKEATTSAKKTAVRFNDSVSVLRIKARKKKEATITSSFLEALQQQLPSGEAELQSDSPSSDEDGHANNEAEDEDEDEEDSDDDAEDDASDSAAEELSEDPEDMVSSLAMDIDEESENEASDIEAEKETFGRVAGDLFADEESEDEQQRSSQSRHQQRLNVLQEEIAKLERENVGKKEWTLMGEAGSRARPENSLLEQDVDFESNRKAKPVNTPETTQSIEDLIKKRILENQFDDVQRRATLQPLDFIPSKMLELSDAKNPKSLGQVYEEELGGVADTQGARLDKELQKEHEEIDVLYSKLEEQLDALSNAHYTPKAPKVAIRTITDTAAIALEESLSTTMNNGTQLAPEEVYDAGAHNTTLQGASSEMTPEEKQKRHRQLRDEKRTRNDRIAEHKRNVEIHREAFGQNRGGRFVGNASGSGKAGGQRASEEKEEALRKLMGNKGVSVVGKGSGSQANGAKKGTNGTGNASQYKL